MTHLSSYLSKSIEIPKITVSEIGKDLICNNSAYWGLVLKQKNLIIKNFQIPKKVLRPVRTFCRAKLGEM